MTFSGVIFMVTAWAIVGSITCWCFYRILFPKERP